MSKNALVIGYGASGKASEELLKAQGYTVFVFDDLKTDLPQGKSAIDLQTLPLSMALISPGVPLDHPVCRLMNERMIPLVGESEYALSFLPQRKIAITGTNGKTTVTLLCEHLLKKAGYDAIACGNISKDKALASFVTKASESSVLVVELSSFQLETLLTPQFETGIILNITPDHLDRYSDMHAYAEVKFRLQYLVKELFVYDEALSCYPELLLEKASVFSLEKTTFPFAISFASAIDHINAYAAYLLLKPFNINPETFKEGLMDFKKPAHRFEKVHTVSGIEFINDSKATNIDATIQALKSTDRAVILLAGGVDKGHPYSAWIPYLGHVKQVVCFGAAQGKIYSDLAPYIDCVEVETLPRAIAHAYELARSGDIILFSPGCSSFDAFKDYADRGNQFCENVLKLKPKENYI